MMPQDWAALRNEPIDPEALEVARALIKDPAAIPYMLDGPPLAAARVLKALAALIAEMNARLTVLEALYHAQIAGDRVDPGHSPPA